MTSPQLCPFHQGVAEALAELRPYLPLRLRELSDDTLLTLANWTIMAAWTKSVEFIQDDAAAMQKRIEKRTRAKPAKAVFGGARLF